MFENCFSFQNGVGPCRNVAPSITRALLALLNQRSIIALRLGLKEHKEGTAPANSNLLDQPMLHRLPDKEPAALTRQTSSSPSVS